MLNCSESEAQLLVSKDALEILLENLMDNNTNLLIESLRALFRFFMIGEQIKENYNGTNPYVWRVLNSNATQLIEALQYHTNKDVYREVAQLLDHFFPVEVEQNQNLIQEQY